MKIKSTALILSALLLGTLLLLPSTPGEAKMGISGRERVRTLDVRIRPDRPGEVDYAVHLANGLIMEGSMEGWEAADQFLRVSNLMNQMNITVFAELDNDKLTGLLIRSGTQFP